MVFKELDDLNKLYFTISEVSDMFGVSKSLIRYWETEFTFLKPHKNSKGDRRFTRQNIEQLQLIYHLVKEKGFTLEGAKNEIRESKKKLTSRQQLLDTLSKLKKDLEDLSDSLT
ncbi:MAG: MerR family transcriptional regulator [Saprospiraceae bacterium]